MRGKVSLKFAVVGFACIFVFAISFFLGHYAVNPLTAIRIILSRVLPLSVDWSAAEESVVMKIRLPRICAAALVGAALSVAGTAFQGIFRNPMVSPDLLGASAGAGFGASLAILFGASYFTTVLFSFALGLVAVFISFAVSKTSRIQTVLAMILSGVLVSSLFQSGIGFVKLVADADSQLPSITYWLLGSFSAVRSGDLVFAAVPVLLGFIPVFLLRWRINLLSVSEAEARSMGVMTDRLRLVIIVSATLMSAACVSISGMIGWVGLVIPHFSRMIFGNDCRHLVPSSALLGALFLMVVDDIARIATASEIPIGILTSFAGAPVFLYLIVTGGTQRET